MIDWEITIPYAEIKQMDLFKDLNLSNQEIQSHYLKIKKIIHDEKLCNDDKKCQLGGYHTRLIRNKFNELEIITIKCPHLKNKYSPQIKHAYMYSDINIKRYEQLLKKEDIAVDNKKDKDRVKLINWLLKSKKTDTYKSFYLYGEMGTGKTYLIMAYLNELAIKNKKIVVINMPNLVNNLLKMLDEDKKMITEFCDMLQLCDVLLIDELGNEHINKYVHFSIFYSILIHRTENNKTTILISNYNLNDLQKNYLLDTSSKKVQTDIKRLINRIDKMVDSNIYRLSHKYNL